MRCPLLFVILCAGFVRAQDEVKVPPPVQPEMPDIKVWGTPPSKDGQPAAPPEAMAPMVRQILEKQARELSSGRPVLHHRIPDEVFHDALPGSLWASSRRFKSQFTGSGMSFIPYLGSHVPRNFPFTLSFEEARVGALPVVFAGTVAPVRSGDVIAYDRGLLHEVYEVTTRHVEQKFVLQAFPGQGDLVVRMRVATELPFEAASEGFRFRNMYGGVTYGKATVVDAGRRAEPAESRFEEGAIELVVPASFLASAVYPVTIDPVIQPFVQVDTSDLNMFLPDIAYDVTTDRYLVVFEQAFSGVDHDIWAETRTATGAPVAGGGGYIDQSSDFWAIPKCANNNIANNFLVVAQRQPLGGGAWSIWGRTRHAGSIIMGPPMQISGAELGDKVNPDVGGDPSLAPPTFYCVTWQRNLNPTDADIHFRMVAADSTLPGAPNLLENAPSRIDFAPTISKSNGNPPSSSQDWTIVWSFQWTPTDTDIYGARVHWDGTVTNGTFPIETSIFNEIEPTVSSPTDLINGGRTYLVAYERVLSTVDGDLLGRILNRTSLVSDVANLSTLFSMTMGRRETSPTVDSDGCRFAVGYEFYFSAGDVDVYVGTVHLAGSTISLSDGGVAWTVPSTSDASPEITSTRSGGGAPVRYAQVWDTYPTGNNGNILMGLYEGHRPAGGHTAGVGGCGGLTLTATGTPALGASVRYSLAGFQPGGAPVLLLGTPTTLPLCPACTIGVSLAGALILPVGSFAATIPCDPVLLGAVIAIQGGDHPASSGCPVPGGNVRTSNSIHIQIQ